MTNRSLMMGTATLWFWLIVAAVVVAVLLDTGCVPRAKTVERDFCSNAAYRAVNVGCQTLLRNARTLEEVDAVEGYCLVMIAAQDAACKEVPHGLR